MAAMLNDKRFYQAFALGVALVFVALSIGSALTKRPWSDEGWFASPAFNLSRNGVMGTLVLEPAQAEWLKGIDRHTYWTVPLHLVTQAGWYEIFGFGLLQMRTLSMMFGLVGLLSWYVIMKALSGSEKVALATLTLLAFDYVYVSGSSFGRMDLMCATLGFAALASYLWFRERNLPLAILISHSLVAASGMTHFLGILHLAGLLFFTLYFDRTRLSWRHVPVAAVPYMIGATGWGLYILQSPDDFFAQFSGNAANSGRLSGFSAPLTAFKAEIAKRYLVAFGLGPRSAGHTGPIMLKILILVAYVMGIIGVVASRRIRQHKGYRALLILTGLYFLIMTILDGQKLAWYLVHIIPLYTAILVVWLQWCWHNRFVPRWMIVLGVCGFVSIQLGGLLYRMKLNTYQKSYAPAVDFLKRNSNENTLVMGTADLGFGLGFDSNLVDDYQLGYRSGKKPDIFVIEEVYEEAISGNKTHRPQLYYHVMRTLQDEYRLVYDQNFYKVYAHQKHKSVGGS
ncbi:MAG: glycosyltransferase family 39 protein [Pyrinomonadaceae bacterium]|nr:glycosyltransferase family 39 protein [Pyrinomonadaceae bacterium]